jgi:hypothetical protein
VETALDAGSGAAVLEVGTTGMASVLVTFTLSDPAGSVSGDTLTGSSMPKTATAANSGTAGEARLKDSAGNVVVSGLTVGTSGTNIIISPSTSITSGQTCTLDSMTLTHNTAGA